MKNKWHKCPSALKIFKLETQGDSKLRVLQGFFWNGENLTTQQKFFIFTHKEKKKKKKQKESDVKSWNNSKPWINLHWLPPNIHRPQDLVITKACKNAFVYVWVRSFIY